MRAPTPASTGAPVANCCHTLLHLCLCSEGASDSEVNSTEISTDSEFDDEQPHRIPPAFHLEFKPLVEVDPTIKLVQNRAPLAVPRPGDYVLSKTASTEGIASKKSLELKKKYLLGEGTTGLGILKSGSASALDSKFKSFHSNITECQKLLNPATMISPTMQTFLKGSQISPAPAAIRASEELPVSATVPTPEVGNDTEKENVYEGNRTANGSTSNNPALAGTKRSSLVETINATLVENKLNEIKSNESFLPAAKEESQAAQSLERQSQSQNVSPLAKSKQQQNESNGLTDRSNKISNNNMNSKNNIINNNNDDDDVMEIIDLVTPEKVKESSPTHRDGLAKEKSAPEMKYITNMKHAYIDLTTDSPNCDRSLVETTLDFSITPAKINGERPTDATSVPDIISSIRIDSNENKIEPHVTNGGTEKPKVSGESPQGPQQGEDGCHETTLQVPNVPWSKEEEEEIESDSISESGSNSSASSSSSTSSTSSSSTSSVEDIPHFILDSTTSPETQNDERFVPRLEVRDATGELMQIDSLMIIDGRYIGDPEDLKLMEKLPPDTQIAAQMLQAEMNQDSISTVIENAPAHVDSDEEDGRNRDAGVKTPVAETKPDEEDEERISTPTPPANVDGDDKHVLPASPIRTSGGDPISPLADFVCRRNPCFKFDSRNENKIDTLKNLPFVLDVDQRGSVSKPKHLSLTQHKPAELETDAERTPMAGEVPATPQLKSPITASVPHDADSDSQDDTEVTTHNNLTETELSDWAADDAVSENFVDIEFALNSNKGTIRRNHKPKHTRLQQKKLPNGNGSAAQRAATVPAPFVVPVPPVRTNTGATEDGIIRNLALEDIEFMDTGSEEESCIETYSTTNRMMLKNRGYVEIMDPTAESKRTNYPLTPLNHAYSSGQPKLVEAINKQVAGRVDYIEQGAFLLAADDAKTPMNEEPPAKITFSSLAAAQNARLTEPAVSVESAPDIEEDSLLIVSSSQGTATGTTTNSTATTEESEALTMVAPLGGSGPGSETSLVAKPSGSSGRASVTSFSSSLRCGAINGNGSQEQESTPKTGSRPGEESPIRKVSVESSSGKRSSLERKDARKDSLKSIEDIGYEKYVKRLQQKIQQISNARDSLEVKKTKRKSSKGEMVLTLAQAGLDADEQETDGATPTIPDGGVSLETLEPHGSRYGTETPRLGTSPGPTLEPPKSVEKKIEEITKERVKQKDIIHDLVMDKLQTKKQLNAEKRLNRSRNRSSVLVGQAATSNGAHGSVGPAEDGVGSSPARITTRDPRAVPLSSFRSGSAGSSMEKERTPLTVSNQSNMYGSVSSVRGLPSGLPMGVKMPLVTSDAYKENIASLQQDHSTIYTSTPAYFQQQQPSMVTPRTVLMDPEQQPPTTEQLREEARSRARLKSNQDLGLSPEDRLLLIRKKYHKALRGLTDDDDVDGEPNRSDDAKCKEQLRTKLITSKSVNDVSMLKLQQQPQHQSQQLYQLYQEHHNHHLDGLTGADPMAQTVELQHHSAKKLSDYISDPNIVHSGACEQDAGTEVRLRTRGKRKDRERRKSIIEKVSEFFNGRKKADSSKEASPTKDRPSQLGSSNGGPSDPATASSSSTGGGGFLRFKISPKLKDKSKSCFDMRNISCGTKEGSPYGRCASDDYLNSNASNGSPSANSSPPMAPAKESHQYNRYTPIGRKEAEELEPPPIPPLPLHYQRSDDEGAAANESKNELKKQRAMSKTSRQAELKRLRIAQEIQREQEEIDVKIKDLETRGVEIEKELRGESETLRKGTGNPGANDDGLVKELLEIMNSVTQLKVRDQELSIRQQELQLEHRHAQLKEELNMRLSFGKLDKNSSDVAAEGAILNEMLEIVAKRQALRPSPDAKAATSPVGRAGGHDTDHVGCRLGYHVSSPRHR
ncbi:F-actin-monooxygenase Mical-like [Anopheles nili]|uniref:F-actin-monooxygenase Mical-like n=1 Tax=Anopheles nili TaxID=185578 RepID=UPI00237A553F|nr:F-actin-monooxygenase Mical-like [Anopheles nili]